VASQTTTCNIYSQIFISDARCFETNYAAQFFSKPYGAGHLLHYLTLQAKFGSCPIPIIFGPLGTGKTTALHCGLSMMGITESRFWSGGSKEKYLQLCCDSYLPLGIDDPHSKAAISDLCMALFNSAQEGTISRGTNKPMSTAIVAANFTVNESEK